jgi:hypothetical protein
MQYAPALNFRVCIHCLHTVVHERRAEQVWKFYITKYAVEFSNSVNLVGIRDPDLVLLLYVCVHVLL